MLAAVTCAASRCKLLTLQVCWRAVILGWQVTTKCLQYSLVFQTSILAYRFNFTTHLQPAILAGAHSPSSWQTAPALRPAFCRKLLVMPFRALAQAVAERFAGPVVHIVLNVSGATPWKSARHFVQAGHGLSWHVPTALHLSSPL